MIHAQNEKVVAEVPTAAVGATATATLTIDTLGYDHASISLIRASNASQTFANVLRVDEGDTTSSYSTVTSLVGGGVGGFSIPTIAASATGAASIMKIDVDTRARRRYLRVSYTPGASATVGIVANLSRAETAPVTAGEAGVIGLVKG